MFHRDNFRKGLVNKSFLSPSHMLHLPLVITHLTEAFALHVVQTRSWCCCVICLVYANSTAHGAHPHPTIRQVDVVAMNIAEEILAKTKWSIQQLTGQRDDLLTQGPQVLDMFLQHEDIPRFERLIQDVQVDHGMFFTCVP